MSLSPVTIRPVEPMPLASVRRRVTRESVARTSMSVPIWSLSLKRRLKGLDEMVIVYHDNHLVMLLDHPDGCDVDIGVRLAEPFEDDAILKCVMTPVGIAAHARLCGPYEMLPVIHTDIRAWCIEQEKPITGVCWEHYAVWHEDSERLVTDVYYLLEEQKQRAR
jgi:hypothetical protein